MRLAPIVLALMLLLPLGASAPGATPAGPLLSDPTGDVVVNATGGPLDVPSAPLGGNDVSAGADLAALDIVESDESLLFTLSVAGFSGPDPGSDYDIDFTFHDAQYRIDLIWYAGPTNGIDIGFLETPDRGGYSAVANLAPSGDASSGKIVVEVAKAYILDAQHNTPTRGDVLAQVHVASDRNTGTYMGVEPQASDVMPDSGGVDFPIARGDEAFGTLALTTTERVRVSNGGATTFVYRATVVNKADRDDTVDLALADMPAGWNGTVHSPVRVAAKSTSVVTILASVPFAHVHGGFSSFNVTAQSQADPGAHARLRLGVLHTPIPQPAGHHSDLYLHGRHANNPPMDQAFTYSSFWMNTEGAHDNDALDVPANECTDANSHQWNIALSPSLQMGMDWDLSRTGTLDGELFGRTQGTGSVEAKVWMSKTNKNETDFGNGRILIPKGSVLLAQGKSEGLTYDLQTATSFHVALATKPEADYVPYDPDQNLWLSVEMFSDGQDTSRFVCSGVAAAPGLGTAAFKMTLPLEEYSDRLAGISEAASALDLKADGPVEKLARPGTLMTYAFTLQNTGFSADDFDAEATGTDGDIATLVPGGTIHLEPKGTTQLTLGVRLPEKANDQQAFEVLLFVHSKTDPSKSVVARTKTIVALHGDATADESRLLKAAEQANKKTPGFEAGFLVVAALGVALRSRRR